MADRDGLHGAARVQQLVANKRAADIPATVAMALGKTETEFGSDITLKFAGLFEKLHTFHFGRGGWCENWVVAEILLYSAEIIHPVQM